MTNAVFSFTNTGPVTINVVVGSDALPATPDPVSEFAPSSDYWDMAIMVISPAAIWVLGRYFPKLPKMCLPLLSPVIGVIAGIGVNLVTNAHLGWWAMAKAGMVAVFIREVTNQTITKSLQKKDKPEEESPASAAQPAPRPSSWRTSSTDTDPQ